MLTFVNKNLHSSMDRFKDYRSRKIESGKTYIYIPVWIDLKIARVE